MQYFENDVKQCFLAMFNISLTYKQQLLVIKPQSLVSTFTETDRSTTGKKDKKDKKSKKASKKDIPEELKQDIVKNGQYDKHEALVKEDKDGNLTVYQGKKLSKKQIKKIQKEKKKNGIDKDQM